MTREDYLEVAGEFLAVLNEKRVTIEDAENIAEMFNTIVKKHGEMSVEEYREKSSVFLYSSPKN